MSNDVRAGMRAGDGGDGGGTFDCLRFSRNFEAYLAGGMTAGEQQLFEKHAAACPACRAELEAVRAALSAYEAEPDIEADAAFVRDVMARLRPAAASAPAASTGLGLPGGLKFMLDGMLHRLGRHAPVPLLAVSLVLLLVVFLPGLFDRPPAVADLGDTQSRPGVDPSLPGSIFRRDSSGRPVYIPVGRDCLTGAGETETLALDGDRGSIVLYPSSRLRVETRGVRLVRGRARFELDLRGRRFEVSTDRGTVIVWGTGFEVSVEHGKTVVTLFHGKVIFRCERGEFRLSPGDRLTASPSGVELQGASAGRAERDRGGERRMPGKCPAAGTAGVSGPFPDRAAGGPETGGFPAGLGGGKSPGPAGPLPGAAASNGGKAEEVDVEGGDDLDHIFGH